MALLVQTKLTVTNEFLLRQDEVMRLLTKYVPEFRQVYRGWRSPGAEDIEFPCAMVECRPSTEDMVSVGKYELRIKFEIFFYVVDGDPTALAQKQSDIMACLTKLFSNNGIVEYIAANPADADAPATNKFKSNPGFWVSSEMEDITFSSLFKWSDPRGEYARAGRLVLNIWDQVIK